MGLAGWSLAFALSEMGVIEGLEEKSNVTRLNAPAFMISLASAWRGDAGGDRRAKAAISGSCCNIQERLTPGCSAVVAVGREECLDSGHILQSW